MYVKQAIIALTAGATFAVVVGVGSLLGASRAHADDDADEFRARQGLQIAPVNLNLPGLNRELVGLGSYLVNAVGSCNICHSAGTSTEYAPGGNPYFKGSPPTVVNQATYLGGGRVFPSQVAGATPAIVSRNLTPDKTGRPAGGLTFDQFRLVMRTGVDLDHAHPNCTDPTIIASSTCYPLSLHYNGDVLQIMPWPILAHMSDHDLRAIYEYLRAVPCLTGPATGLLHNDCT